MNQKPDEFDDTLHDEHQTRVGNSSINLRKRSDRLENDQRQSPMSSEVVADSAPVTKDDLRNINAPNPTPAMGDYLRPKSVGDSLEFCLPSRIGRFDIVKRLGTGGYGIVFLAIDPGVGREVAIKIPRTDLLSSREQLIRFAREANIVGLLEHPNIVPVYESDCDGTVPYIVMPYIRGKTLREWRAGEPNVSPHTAAEIVRQLAAAVQHAHERGVLHRDLKPGNVLLASVEKDDTRGALEFVPKLTDFGSAKCESIDAEATRTGAMIGTTVYMSPEQIEGRNREITAQTDVYGLGVILYEMLTGHPPFRCDSVPETLQKISTDDPASFESFHVNVPLNLKIICLKCLEKMPTNRYRSASALADDLQRFLDGEPISARPVSTVVRIAKSCRRHPFRAATVLLAVFGVLALTSISLYYNALLVKQLDQTESARRRALQQELRAVQSEETSRKRAYISDMRNAKLSWDQGDVRQTLKLLDRHVPQSGQSDIRNLAWWYLWREYHESSRILGTHEKEATSVAITGSGDLAASGGTDCIIKLWSLSSEKLIAELRGHELGPIHSLSFSPTGNRLVSGGEDGTLRVWDVAAGKELIVRREHQSAVVCVLYSPQGNLIASGGMDGTIRLWDSETAEPLGVLSGHSRKTRCLAFHPTDPLLVSGSLDGTIRFWNLDDDGINARYMERARCDVSLSNRKLPGCYPRAIAIEPNGDSLIAATTGREVVHISLLEHNFGHLIESSLEAHQPHTLTWLRENEWLVGLGNSQIRMADARSPEHTLISLKGHTDAVFSIAVAADASCLVSASRDGGIRYWPKFMDRNRFRITPEGTGADSEASRVGSVQWCGRYLAIDDLSRRQVSIFRMPERTLERTISYAEGGTARLSPSGKHILLVEPDGVATCIRAEDGTKLWATRFTNGSWKITTRDSVVIDHSDQWIGIMHEKQLVVMSLSNSQVKHRLEHPYTVENILFLDKKDSAPSIISTDFRRDLRIWDVQVGRLSEMHSIDTATTISLAISSNQRLVACMSTDNRIRIWKLEGMVEVSSTSTQNVNADHISFLFGGSNILAYGSQGLTLWDIDEEAELIGFPEFLNTGGNFAISPDGKQLAVSLDGWIHLIDGRSADEFENQSRISKDR
jgi:serine/threonine protein kinase